MKKTFWCQAEIKLGSWQTIFCLQCNFVAPYNVEAQGNNKGKYPFQDDPFFVLW
jgi:hypothetical protein